MIKQVKVDSAVPANFQVKLASNDWRVVSRVTKKEFDIEIKPRSLSTMMFLILSNVIGLFDNAICSLLRHGESSIKISDNANYDSEIRHRFCSFSNIFNLC